MAKETCSHTNKDHLFFAIDVTVNQEGLIIPGLAKCSIVCKDCYNKDLDSSYSFRPELSAFPDYHSLVEKVENIAIQVYREDRTQVGVFYKRTY